MEDSAGSTSLASTCTPWESRAQIVSGTSTMTHLQLFHPTLRIGQVSPSRCHMHLDQPAKMYTACNYVSLIAQAKVFFTITAEILVHSLA